MSLIIASILSIIFSVGALFLIIYFAVCFAIKKHSVDQEDSKYKK